MRSVLRPVLRPFSAWLRRPAVLTEPESVKFLGELSICNDEILRTWEHFYEHPSPVLDDLDQIAATCKKLAQLVEKTVSKMEKRFDSALKHVVMTYVQEVLDNIVNTDKEIERIRKDRQVQDDTVEVFDKTARAMWQQMEGNAELVNQLVEYWDKVVKWNLELSNFKFFRSETLNEDQLKRLECAQVVMDHCRNFLNTVGSSYEDWREYQQQQDIVISLDDIARAATPLSSSRGSARPLAAPQNLMDLSPPPLTDEPLTPSPPSESSSSPAISPTTPLIRASTPSANPFLAAPTDRNEQRDLYPSQSNDVVDLTDVPSPRPVSAASSLQRSLSRTTSSVRRPHPREPYTRYSVIPITGDGRCLFRAVVRGRAIDEGYDLLEDLERKEADRLRCLVSETMRRQAVDFAAACIVEGDIYEHCSKLLDPNFYAGEPELLVLTHIVEAPVWVYIAVEATFQLIQE